MEAQNVMIRQMSKNNKEKKKKKDFSRIGLP